MDGGVVADQAVLQDDHVLSALAGECSKRQCRWSRWGVTTHASLEGQMTNCLPLHHFGFVVADIEGSMAGFMRSLGGAWDGQIFHDPHQRVRVAFLAGHAGSAQIELVTPAGPGSPVARFLEQRGGGLHHVCYETSGLEAELAAMRSRGALLIRRPMPAVAFQARRIAWVLTPEKLLVELLEAA
jgi:methylmalonyl-CoA/ethylmalonyl-CoA epimerase